MNFITVTCPRCRRRLTVAPSAPRILTCPSCLMKLEKPQAAEVLPMPVLPVEDQVRRDAAGTFGSIIALAALLIGGLLTAMQSGFRGGSNSLLLPVVGVAVIAFVAVAAIMKRVRPDDSTGEIVASTAEFFVKWITRFAALIMLLIGLALLILLGICGLMLTGHNF